MLIEKGIVVGSNCKYETRNPLGRFLLSRFDRAVEKCIRETAADTVLEIGCGEGHVTRLLLNHTNARILATDISQRIIEETEKSIMSQRVTYQAVSLERITSFEKYDLVVCCEVLEHLPDPEAGLKSLHSIHADWFLLSVPREPIWRMMNMLRGAYLPKFGNSPGHLQHWSKNSFMQFIQEKFSVVLQKNPVPWTMVLCRKKHLS